MVTAEKYPARDSLRSRRERDGEGMGRQPRREADATGVVVGWCVHLLIKRRAKSYIISLQLVVKLRVRVVLCCTNSSIHAVFWVSVSYLGS